MQSAIAGQSAPAAPDSSRFSFADRPSSMQGDAGQQDEQRGSSLPPSAGTFSLQHDLAGLEQQCFTSKFGGPFRI